MKPLWPSREGRTFLHEYGETARAPGRCRFQCSAGQPLASESRSLSNGSHIFDLMRRVALRSAVPRRVVWRCVVVRGGAWTGVE